MESGYASSLIHPLLNLMAKLWHSKQITAITSSHSAVLTFNYTMAVNKCYLYKACSSSVLQMTMWEALW